MANTLTSVMGFILARSLPLLRHQAYMLRLVNTDYSEEAAKPGQVINVEVPGDQTATDVTPGVTAPTPSNYTATTVPVQLTNWKHSDFHLTHKEMGEIANREDYLPRRVEGAVKALAYALNASVWANYKKVFGWVGTPGTALYSTDADSRNVRMRLNQQLCPREGRALVLDHVADAAALGLASFANFEQSGDQAVKIKGQIGEKFGLLHLSDDQVPTHTAGTGASYLVNDSGGMAIGETLVTVDTGSGTILVGDVVTFAGHTQTYTVTAALASNQFSIYPPLIAAVADNAAVTVKGTGSSYVNCLGFTRDAFALAVRPLEQTLRNIPGASTIASMTMIDELTGIPLRLEVLQQYKQVVWDLDILWGTACVYPEMATRLVY